MSQAARVRGSVGPEESVGRVLICADGLCNSWDHMTVTSRPAQRLSAPTNSLTGRPFKHKWVTLMEETRARRTHSSQADIPAFDPPPPTPPTPCSRTHHSIFSVATQIRSVNWTRSERGGGEECHRDPKPRKNRDARGRTARWLWIVYDPAGRQHNESAGSARARPWRDGDEAFVLGAGAASQKVKEKKNEIKTGNPWGVGSSAALLRPNHYSSVAQRAAGATLSFLFLSFMASGTGGKR